MSEAKAAPSMWKVVLFPVALTALCVVAFWNVRHCQFLEIDDAPYITQNAHVLEGFKGPHAGANLAWAWSAPHEGQYMPVTWMSLMADGLLGGDRAWVTHVMNLAIHVLNVILMGHVLALITGSKWRSLIAAALFAVSPLRVESIAWSVERKDVLVVFFGLLALWLYTTYARRGSWLAYAGMFLALVCSLLSKPTLVTFPFLMLLLDAWPLRRLRREETANALLTNGDVLPDTPRASWGRVLLEKPPMLLAAIAISIVTIHASKEGIATGERGTIAHRLQNVCVSYAAYIEKTVWPSGLTGFYPTPAHWDAVTLYSSIALDALITIVALLMVRRMPWLLVGWLWYCVSLLPNSGIVPMGLAVIADRFSYWPSIGLLLVVVWTPRSDWFALPLLRTVGWAALACLLLAWGVVDQTLVKAWSNDETLYTRTLQQAGPNANIELNYGQYKAKHGDFEAARNLLNRAIKHDATLAEAHTDLGVVLHNLNDTPGAIREEQTALSLSPANRPDRKALVNLGTFYEDENQKELAMEMFRKAIAVDPDYALAHYKLADLLVERHESQAAIAEYRKTIELDPELNDARVNLGLVLADQKDYEEAIEVYKDVVRHDPLDPGAYTQIGRLLLQSGRVEEAPPAFAQAIRINPQDLTARLGLAIALDNLNDPRAAQAYEDVLRLSPTNAQAQRRLAALRQQGQQGQH